MSDEIINTSKRPPWAGRFSRQEVSDDQEQYVVYLPLHNQQKHTETVKKLSEYTDEDQAIRQCEVLIDDFLSRTIKPDMCGNTLYEIYRSQGPDPYVVLESGMFWKIAYAFNAWSYAKAACFQLCNEEQPAATLALADLKGRYSEYNRLQLSAHLLLNRDVTVIGQYEGMLLSITNGTNGCIGLGSPYISGREFDWSVELPVVFKREGMDDVTFGIPYELLELTQSDKEYLEMKAALRAKI